MWHIGLPIRRSPLTNSLQPPCPLNSPQAAEDEANKLKNATAVIAEEKPKSAADAKAEADISEKDAEAEAEGV